MTSHFSSIERQQHHASLPFPLDVHTSHSCLPSSTHYKYFVNKCRGNSGNDLLFIYFEHRCRRFVLLSVLMLRYQHEQSNKLAQHLSPRDAPQQFPRLHIWKRAQFPRSSSLSPKQRRAEPRYKALLQSGRESEGRNEGKWKPLQENKEWRKLARNGRRENTEEHTLIDYKVVKVKVR